MKDWISKFISGSSNLKFIFGNILNIGTNIKNIATYNGKINKSSEKPNTNGYKKNIF